MNGRSNQPSASVEDLLGGVEGGRTRVSTDRCYITIVRDVRTGPLRNEREIVMGLSNAERQARWRAKQAAEMDALRNGAAPSQGAEVDALRKRVTELETALAGKPEPAIITLDMISTKTGREQAEIFVRQHAKRFEGEVRQRVHAEVAAWTEQMLPEYKKRLEESDRVIKTRKGFMKKALFNKFRFAIHEDTYSSRSAKERAELCQWLEEHERVLVAEDEKPTTLPTLEELMRNREAIRRANSERSKAAHARAKAKREAEKREADNSALSKADADAMRRQ